MKKVFLTLMLGVFFSSCTSTDKENTILVEKMEIPYTMVEQSIDLDDPMTLELYFKSGFDPNYINYKGETLLMEIVKSNSIRCLELILGYGVDINEETVIKKMENRTSYESTKRAVDFVKSKKALELLIEAGASIDYKDNLGDSLLIKYIKDKPFNYSTELILSGAKLDVRDSKGWTALIWAVSKRNEELVKLLVEQGADVNIVDKRGNPAIYYGYSASIISSLLTPNLDLKLENKDGENIMGEVYLRSVSNSYYETVKELIAFGVDKNYASYGDTPLGLARENKDDKMIKLLEDLGVRK